MAGIAAVGVDGSRVSITLSYRRRIRGAIETLGIDPAWTAARALPIEREAQRLVPVGLGTDGRDKCLTPAAARAWTSMHSAAQRAGVELLLVSAFRSLDFQLALIRAKLQRGQTLEQVLAINAPPGYSEHHSGRAVDIGTPGCAPLDEAFEKTAAFAWLENKATRFGFHLSYPRGNRHGFLYEPWHWRYL